MHLGPSWRHLGAILAVLEAILAVLEAILGHQGDFESHLEPSWEDFSENCDPYGWPAGRAGGHWGSSFGKRTKTKTGKI